MTAPSPGPCPICADCARVGHGPWTEVRELGSTVPVGFLCGSCDLALKATPVDALRVGDDGN
jgi:hypothetical protein